MRTVSLNLSETKYKIFCSDEVYGEKQRLSGVDMASTPEELLVNEIKDKLGRKGRAHINRFLKEKMIVVLIARGGYFDGVWGYKNSEKEGILSVDKWLEDQEKIGSFLIPMVSRPDDCTQEDPHPKKECYMPKDSEYFLPDADGKPVCIITPEIIIDFA